MRPRLIATIALAVFSIAAPAFSQRTPVYVGDNDYQRLGLEEVWSTQVQIDPNRSSVAGVRLQVIGRDSYEILQETATIVYDVAYGDGGVRSVRSNQLDSYGRMIGREEAKRLAEKLEIRLKAQGFETKLTERQIPKTMMFAQSDGGTLQAMDAETGRLIWRRFVGTPGHPAIAPAANDEYVAAVSGSNLYLFQRDGRPVWSRELKQNPGIGATMAGQRVFVPGIAGRIEAYQLPDDESDHRATPPWVHNAPGHIVTIPVASNSTISWGTDYGSLFVAELIDGQPNLSYRFESVGPIFAGGIVLPPDRLVVANANGFVGLLNRSRGDVIWRFATGSGVVNAPIAHDDEIYVTTLDHRLFRISTEEGTERWVVNGISKVLSSGNKRVYAIDSFNRLTAIDKETGTILGRLPAAGYTIPFVNHLTDRIYLASRSGILLCLREINSRDPSIRVTLSEPGSERSTGGSSTASDVAADEGDTTSDDEGFGDFGDGDLGDDGGDFDFGDDSTDDASGDDSSDSDEGFDFGDEESMDDGGFDFESDDEDSGDFDFG